MATLRIQTNEPVEVKLLDGGEIAPSNFGPDQRKYSTDQGVLYVSEAVAKIFDAAIAIQGIEIGETVVITKREVVNGARRTVRWSLDRAILAGEQSNGTLAVPVARIEPRQAAQVAAPAAAVGEFAARLARETNAIVDAFALALRHANDAYGHSVKPDDVRSILLSAYISASKNGARNAA